MRAAPRLEQLATDERRPYLRQVVVNAWRSNRRRALLERALLRRSSRDGTHQAGPEERDGAWEAVCALPPRQRACVVLRYYEDLTESGTAQILGCSIGTVKSQTSKALARLRKEFDHGN